MVPRRRSFSRCLTTLAETKKAAAISSSVRPFSLHRLESAELIKRMQRARWTFSARLSSSASPSVRTMQGTSAVLFMRFLLDEQLERPEPPPAAGIVYMPVSRRCRPAGRTVMELSSVRRAMSSASSSIDTPALTWRTFDWLSNQLVEGDVARGAEGDLLLLGHRDISANGPAGSLSPDLQTRHRKPGTPLTLSLRREGIALPVVYTT